MLLTRRDASRALGLALVGLSGCAQVLGPQRWIWSEAQLAEVLSRRFPVDRTLLEWLDVEISHPQVSLVPAQGRLRMGLSLAVKDRVFSTRLRGQLTFSAAVAVDAGERALRLRQVQVHEWQLDGLEDSARWPSRMGPQRMGALLTERVLEGLTVYSFKPDDWDRLRKAGYGAPRVRISAEGLEVLVDPA